MLPFNVIYVGGPTVILEENDALTDECGDSMWDKVLEEKDHVNQGGLLLENRSEFSKSQIHNL
jgi:hypothetical protein